MRARLFACVMLAAAVRVTAAADLTSVTIVSNSSSAQAAVPVTFGHVFKPGDVAAAEVIGARLGAVPVPVQVDKKATHADGSLRHAVLTAIVPTLGANASSMMALTNTGTAPVGAAVALSEIVASAFDATLNVNIGGTMYSASARNLLQAGTPGTWLNGPLATEWLVSAPIQTAGGAAHPHLQARFHIRAYQALAQVRVEVVLENVWARETGPRNYNYDVSIDVAGRGTVFSENGLTHYRQSRWRRVVWWGSQPAYDVKHDSTYLMATRAVPTYDPRIVVTSASLNDMQSRLNANSRLMGIGQMEPYMPAPGGRSEIAPLPSWTAAYIISQDARARRVTVGYGEQAGAWPMHYREKSTDQPLSIDQFPSATVDDFPACGGSCNSPYTPEASHHPSLAYVPYHPYGEPRTDQAFQAWDGLGFGEMEYHSPMIDAEHGPLVIAESDQLWAFGGSETAIRAIGQRVLDRDIAEAFALLDNNSM